MLVPKQLNPKRRHKKGRGNPISTSLPRHGARIKDQETKPRADYKLAQQKYKIRRTI